MSELWGSVRHVGVRAPPRDGLSTLNPFMGRVGALRGLRAGARPMQRSGEGDVRSREIVVTGYTP